MSGCLGRPRQDGDATAIFDTYPSDATARRFLTWQPYRSVANTLVYLARCFASNPAASRTYLPTALEDGAVLGEVELHRPAVHRIEFGYVLAGPCWGWG